MPDKDTFDYSKCSIEFANDFGTAESRDADMKPFLDRDEAARKAAREKDYAKQDAAESGEPAPEPDGAP